MNAKERVLKSLAHQEADKVPMFELAFSTRLGSERIGRHAFFPRSGGSSLKHILETNAAGREVRQEAIREGTKTQLEVYASYGYDIMPLIPMEFIQTVYESFGLFGSNYLLDVRIEELGCNKWKVTSTNEDFWSIHGYDDKSNVFYAIDDSIMQDGLKALEKYVEILETNNVDINEHVRDALESISIAVNSFEAKSGNMFILGHCDVCMPTADAFFSIFLEAMVEAPEIIDRFFMATTNGLIPLLKAQLDMGVDGILAANDWCFKSGPIISPAMFERFLVPHLRRICEEVHKKGKPYIKHLDGNTTKLLPMLIDDVGIDAYHSVEPTADMDIIKLKKAYGEKISIWGNVDCGILLTEGTPAEIKEYVRKIIHECAPGGGFVLSSSNAIHDKISMKNLEAMIHARDEYGHYPI